MNRAREFVESALAIAIEPTYFDLERCRIEPGRIADLVARCHANALRVGMFSHQGHAYYPSEIAPHAPGLGGRDLLKEFQKACAEAGLALVVYMNSRFDTQRYLEHPDWAIRRGGEVHPHEAKADLKIYPMCPNSPYLDYFQSLLCEVARKYAPRSIYIDNFGVSMDCECRFCAEAFREATGRERPASKDWSDPNRQTLRSWAMERHLVLAHRLVSAIRSERPDTAVVFNLGGMRSLAGLITPEAVHEFAHTIADQVHCESAVRLYGHSLAHINEQCLLGRACGTALWTWVEYPLLPWSYVSAPPAEVRIKAAKVLANGGRPMVWSLPCAPDGDQRGLAGVAAAFGPAKRFPEYFNHTEHVLFLAVLYSSQTMEAYCRGERERFEECQKEFSGALALARHNHMPADVLLDGQVERGRLSRYRVLVLPNSAALSEEQCTEVRAFVESGGNLVATFESSLYDRSGARRSDFGLAEVLGVRFEKELARQDEHWSTGYSVAEGGHPITGLIEAGLRLPAGGRHLGVREAPDAVRLSTLLTRCRYYCDHPGQPTEYPGLVAHQFGRGRTLYLPGQFGLTYASRGFPDYRRLFLNAVEWMTDGALPVESSLPDSVDVTLTRNSSGALILHLVNCTADPSRPIEHVGPIIGAEIHVRLGDSRPHRARALVAAADLRCEIRDDAAHVVLPILNEHEVIVIEPAA